MIMLTGKLPLPGCAVALLSALSYPGKLAGVACISGWLPFSERINREGPRHRHPVGCSIRRRLIATPTGLTLTHRKP